MRGGEGEARTASGRAGTAILSGNPCCAVKVIVLGGRRTSSVVCHIGCDDSGATWRSRWTGLIVCCR